MGPDEHNAMSKQHPSATRKTPKPVVIYRLGSLGDTIVALPCFHAIERATPGTRRVALTNVPVSAKAAPLEGIVGGSGLIDGRVAYPVGTRSIKALWALRGQLKALGADTLYYLTPARGLAAAWRDLLFFKLCGFKHVIGAPLSRAQQHCQVINDAGHIEPECARLARCLSALGRIDLHDPAMWDLRLTAGERLQAATLMAPLHGQPYLAINMGGKDPIKDWGIANWQSLLGGVTRAWPGLGLLVVGAAEDLARGEQIASLWRGPVVNSCGQLKPRESAAAMTGAAAFIGHDSGPMHLAAAMRVPCVGLFGRINMPIQWHPFGPGHQIIHELRGVEHITVDQVAAVVHALLARSVPSEMLTPAVKVNR
jgi:heptosyltransferase-3